MLSHCPVPNQQLRFNDYKNKNRIDMIKFWFINTNIKLNCYLTLKETLNWSSKYMPKEFNSKQKFDQANILAA